MPSFQLAKLLTATFVSSLTLLAQYPGLSLPPSGDNQRASVTQQIGPVNVEIHYSSPAVHTKEGVDRRGKIWGTLVPYGLTNLGFGSGRPGPWRAGANENTVFATSHDVLINGKSLPAGRYGFHIIANPDEWTLVFSRNSTAWGSFFYDPADDALRVNVKPSAHAYREYLTYEFTKREPATATAELQWEDLSVAFTIAVPKPTELYISKLRRELETVPGFSWMAYLQAVRFCITEKTNLEEALRWAEAAVSMPFVGQANFQTLSAKAQVLTLLNRPADAKTTMQTALDLPGTTRGEIHQYGRQLLAQKLPAEALEIFLFNQKRHGDAWPVHVGLARGYAATGDKAKALQHAKLALAQAPDDLNRNALQALIQSLN